MEPVYLDETGFDRRDTLDVTASPAILKPPGAHRGFIESQQPSFTSPAPAVEGLEPLQTEVERLRTECCLLQATIKRSNLFIVVLGLLSVLNFLLAVGGLARR
jgi:hypothetical protein